MKKILFPIFCALVLPISAAILDDYNDNVFPEKYEGNVSKFSVVDGGLHLSDVSASGPAVLAQPSDAVVNAEWRMIVNMDLNPSSNNYVRFYLVSSNATLDDEGYYVMVGNTDDEVSLYRQQNGKKTKIIDGTNKRLDASSVSVEVRVVRASNGEWNLYSKLNNELDWFLEGTCIDDNIKKSLYSGVYVAYTSSYSTKYNFDNWYVQGEKLPEYPAVTWGDLAFNELMVRPTPIVALPEEEYIEIINLTDSELSTQGLYLCDDSKRCAFPSTTTIAPHAVALLCADRNVEKFAVYGKCIGFSSFPALTDGGKLLWVENADGDVVAAVKYVPEWISEGFKTTGGWSMECLDATNLSNSALNWRASSDYKGGTPAQPNSVATINPDNQEPTLVSAQKVSEYDILLSFSEPMSSSAFEQATYNIANHIIEQIQPLDALHSEVLITTAEPLTQNVAVQWSPNTLQDLAGNVLPQTQANVVVAQAIAVDNLAITEFLLSKKSAGLSFLEIRNVSDKELDLADVYLCNRDENGLTLGVPLATTSTVLAPQQYAVLCNNIADLRSRYSCADEALYLNVKFTAFEVDGGMFVLAKRTAEVITQLEYTSQMIASRDAVSTECENSQGDWTIWHFSVEEATPGRGNSIVDENQDDNTEEDSTPNQNLSTYSKGVSLEEKHFSPNGDGFQDFLRIICVPIDETSVVRMDVFDSTGALRKKLVGRTEISDIEVFEWDGRDKNDALCPAGLYILYAEVETSSRGVKKYKIPFALTF